jgi:uncharacterized cupin superfamily protein
MSERRVINLADVKLDHVGNGGFFQGRRAYVGPEIGSDGLGVSIFEVPSGKSACPHHRHHVTHELFFVLEGEGETRLDDQRHPIRASDLIAAPAGKEAHQIINTGQATLRYLAFSAEGPADIVEFPDSGKMMIEAGLYPNRTIEALGRLSDADYFDGERS